MLRVYLPPNLPAASARDAIAVKLELDLDFAARPPPEALLPALALLQSWCGAAKPATPLYLQLTTAKLRQLLAHLKGQPVFYFLNAPTTPLLWIGPHLRNVSEHLAAAPPPPASPLQGGTDIPVCANPRSPQKYGTDKNVRATLTPLLVDGSENYLAIALPSRESITYPDILALLKTSGFILEPSNRKWWLRNRHKVLNFLAAHLADLRDTYHAQFTPNFEKNTARIKFAEIFCETAPSKWGEHPAPLKGSWKLPPPSYTVTLGLRAGAIPASQLHAATAASRAYLEDTSDADASGNKTIYLIPPAQLTRLAAAQRALASGAPSSPSPSALQPFSPSALFHIPAAALAETETILEEIAPHFQPPEAWRARSEALRNLTKLPPAPIPPALDALLRPYQRLGAAWLWHLREHNLGGILADEMGLGKTIQALALLAAAKTVSAPYGVRDFSPAFDSGIHPAATARITEDGGQMNLPVKSGTEVPHSIKNRNSASAPALVVCPASLVENWRREAARFAPDLRVFVHHGANRLAPSDITPARQRPIQNPESKIENLIITSYGTLARDTALFSETEFDILIADEAQHLKNRRTQNARTLRSLRARSRFLLTGTPLENSLDDLRSLFEVLMPGYIAPVPAGARGDERAWHDERLRARTAPYILRRAKQAVAPELPEKIEQIIYCEFEPPQAALYRSVQETTERALLDLEAGGASENAIRLATLTQLLRLRQVCCDPRLIEKTFPPSVRSDRSDQSTTSYPSAKLDAFRELLAESLDAGHRILVFSQFTKLLALVREELDAQQIPFAYLDGAMPVRARQAEVDRFNAPASAIPVFLISLKAGGAGLNLAAADTVIHLDPWWNPAVEAQATDRAHRIGQTRVVTSYKLICSGTVEEKVLQLQDTKRALLADVFEASDATTGKLSLDDLKSLLN